VLQFVAVCCIGNFDSGSQSQVVTKCVAVGCSGLQCVLACCSGLQCVASGTSTLAVKVELSQSVL